MAPPKQKRFCPAAEAIGDSFNQPSTSAGTQEIDSDDDEILVENVPNDKSDDELDIYTLFATSFPVNDAYLDQQNSGQVEEEEVKWEEPGNDDEQDIYTLFATSFPVNHVSLDQQKIEQEEKQGDIYVENILKDNKDEKQNIYTLSAPSFSVNHIILGQQENEQEEQEEVKLEEAEEPGKSEETNELDDRNASASGSEEDSSASDSEGDSSNEDIPINWVVSDDDFLSAGGLDLSECSEIQIPIMIDNNKNKNQDYFDDDYHYHWESKTPMGNFPIFRRRTGAPEFGLTQSSDFGRDRKKARNFWKMFITDKMIKEIVKCTNIEGYSKIGEKWKNTDPIEIEALIGLWYCLGVTGLTKLPAKTVFSTEPGIGTAEANSVMSRNRYELLMRFLRFDVVATRNKKDGLAPVRKIFEMFKQNCLNGYVPGLNVTIDESMASYRGRCHFKMYLPSKPCKYGIKIWCVVDSESYYLYDCNIYFGKNEMDKREERNLSSKVVLDLMKNLNGAGRTLTTDNYFSSVSLAEKLYSQKTYFTGTVRSNRKGIPQDWTREKAELYESRFLFCGPMTLLKYQARAMKTVYLLSTKHHDPEVANNGFGKAKIVLDYNSKKGGVDTLDQMIASYTCYQISRRWPIRVFGWLLDAAALNASRLYAKRNEEVVSTDKMNYNLTRRKFLVKLYKELMASQQERRAASGHWYSKMLKEMSMMQEVVYQKYLRKEIREKQPPSNFVVHREPRKQQRCGICPRKSDKKSTLSCDICGTRICKSHIYKYIGTCCSTLDDNDDMEYLE